jgi:hypothetical protein
MKSLVANPIEFYSCFISYSTKDQEFAERLHGDLQTREKRDFIAQNECDEAAVLSPQAGTFHPAKGAGWRRGAGANVKGKSVGLLGSK